MKHEMLKVFDEMVESILKKPNISNLERAQFFIYLGDFSFFFIFVMVLFNDPVSDFSTLKCMQTLGLRR